MNEITHGVMEAWEAQIFKEHSKADWREVIRTVEGNPVKYAIKKKREKNLKKMVVSFKYYREQI